MLKIQHLLTFTIFFHVVSRVVSSHHCFIRLIKLPWFRICCFKFTKRSIKGHNQSETTKINHPKLSRCNAGCISNTSFRCGSGSGVSTLCVCKVCEAFQVYISLEKLYEGSQSEENIKISPKTFSIGARFRLWWIRMIVLSGFISSMLRFWSLKALQRVTIG